MAIPFLYIQASGSYRELGRAVGEGAREQIGAAIAFYEEHFSAMAGIDFAEAERQALTYLPFAQRYLPQYVEELEGMAEGSGQPFVKLLVPNCAEEFTCPVGEAAAAAAGGGERENGPGHSQAPVAGHFCTAVAAMTAERHLVGHNMDWYVVDVDKNVLFDLTTPTGTRIVTIAGVPYLPILGMNSHGVAYVGNSVYSNDDRPGVPNVFVRRWALEAESLEEAAARAAMPARARGSNHLNAQAGGLIWDVEVSATRALTIEADGWLVHTNHFTSPQMQDVERSVSAGSRLRLERGRELVAAGLARGDDPFDLVAAVLSDHANAPTSICAHPLLDDPVHGPTTGSVIIEVEERRMHVCAGRPCENPYRVVELD